jgi:serine/threonine protein kinase/Tfp pilus assembly protein PilF
MDPERWRLIEDIYERALLCPPPERDALLASSCAGDADLRREVESLLASNDAAGDFLSAGEFTAQIAELHTEPAAPIVGRTLAKYEILSEIGAGSMGEVYLARDTVLNRQVAIKLLPRRFTSDPDRVARFVREAKAASALNHPNILTIYEVGQVEDTWFIATEFVDGVSLRQRLSEGTPELREAIDLMLQCTAALETAHRAGIIHRDLKPENVMVRPDGVVKIVDFGLARMGVTDSGAALPGATQHGHVMGTPRYMSPEQARGDSVDARTDVFSLTVMLYEMVAGRPLLTGGTTAEVFADLLSIDVPARLETVAALPYARDLVAILARGLQTSRETRYASMQAFAADLAALRTRVQSGAGDRWFLRPTRVRRWKVASAAAAAAALAAAVGYGVVRQPLARPVDPPIASLAVLPFVNLSSDPDREYIVDGITDQLITDLARATSLRVISRTSVMRYKGKSQPLPEVARALGVDAVVEGSLRRSDGRILVAAQLLDARQDRHLWSRNYDRTDADLVALPAEIARDISREFLGKPETPRTAGRSARPAAPEAYDAYLRGRHAWNARTPDGYRQALDFFNAAVDKDPAYAEAYAGLADTYLLLGEYLIWPPAEAFPRARAAAAKAIEIDETLAQPYAALGQINANEWKWADADREFQRAVERDPGYATGRQWRAEYLAISGRGDEALAEIRQALALDPLSPIINTQLGWILIIVRQPDAAIAQLRQTIEMAPRFVQAYTNLGIAYDVKGDHQAALDAFTQAVEVGGGADTQLWKTRQLVFLGQQAEARAELTRLLPVAEQGQAGNSTVALVYVALDDVERGLSWLRQGCARKSVGPAVYPPFDRIRSDPRFVAIMKCMELPTR